MATVPRYDNFQVAPTVGGVGAFSPGSGPNAGSIGAAQTAQFGESISRAGNTASQLAMRDLEEQNQTIAMGAVNQAKERLYDLTNGAEGYQSLKGIQALQRPDGQDLATEYATKFDQAAAQIADNLPNPIAKRMFQQQAMSLRSGIYGQAQAHMLQESRNYQGTVYDGAAANAQRDLVMNYTDVSKGGAVDSSVKAIEASVRAKARLLGQSQEYADVLVRKEVSNAHVLALSAALENNNVAFAAGYLKKYSGQMDADDILRVQGAVTKEMDFQQATAAVGKAMQSAVTTIMPTDASRAFSIAVGTESNNRQFAADGAPLTSPKGAVGVAQVMEGTGPEAAKLAGLPWDAERWKNDRDYNYAIGKAYFDNQLRSFGSLPLAYAAYNAGPGAVRAAQKAAEKDGNPDGWLARLPAETRNYVEVNMAAFNAGQGAPRVRSKTEVVAEAVSNLGPNASRTAVESARRMAEHQYDTVTADKKRADDEATANAMRLIQQNGGTYEQLPPAVRARIPAEDVGKVIDFGKKLAKGSDETNDALYLRLTDDSYLKSLDDNAFYKLRAELSEGDFKHFSNQRAQLKAGKAGQGPGELNTEAINSALKSRLAQLGIKDSGKLNTSEEQRLGSIQRFVRESIGNAQSQAGKKFSDVETIKHIDGLFAKNTDFRTTFFGTPDNIPVLSMKPSDIPAKARSEIEKDFRARGIKPTDYDILGVYWRLRPDQRAQTEGSW